MREVINYISNKIGTPKPFYSVPFPVGYVFAWLKVTGYREQRSRHGGINAAGSSEAKSENFYDALQPINSYTLNCIINILVVLRIFYSA